MDNRLFIHKFINDVVGSPPAWGSLSGRLRNATGRDTQTKPGLKVPYRPQGLVLSHPQLSGIGSRGHPLFDLSDNDRGYRITSDPPVFGFNANRTQHVLRLGFVLSLADLKRFDQLNRKSTLGYQRLLYRRGIGIYSVPQRCRRRPAGLFLPVSGDWEKDQPSNTQQD
jgi:hypothetical protein